MKEVDISHRTVDANELGRMVSFNQIAKNTHLFEELINIQVPSIIHLVHIPSLFHPVQGKTQDGVFQHL